MIWFLFISIAVLVYINYKISHSDLFNPAVVSTGMFAIFSLFCCIANLCIGIDIECEMTFFVILSGLAIFSFVNYVFCISRKQRTCRMEISNLSAGYGILGLTTILLLIYVNYHYIMDFSAAYGFGGDFFEAMVQYKVIMTFHDSDDILVAPPWYRNVLMVMAAAFAYFSIYVFIKRKIVENKLSLIYGFNIFLYIIYSLMGGGRSETFRVITALIFMWYIFYREKNISCFSAKHVLARIIVLMSIVSFLFIAFIYVVGRSQADMDFEAVIMAMFIYAGAPIFNLDIYLQNPWTQTHGIFGELTFIRLINWLGGKLGDSSLIYELDLPFLSYQNYNLGNVFTTFYAFIYDFGFMGVVVLTGIMAVVCVWLYNKVNYVDIMSNRISLYVICYAYLLNDIVMLPFSNRFYECTFNIGTWDKWVMLFVLVKIINVSSKRQSS